MAAEMDTPKIHEKIGKYQRSVFFKSSWVVFLFNFFAQVGVETIRKWICFS